MLIPGTNIRVDNFEIHNNDIKFYVFFLTHFHSDHLRGLHANWNGGIIYTSEMTRRLLVTKYPLLQDKVKSLQLLQLHWIPIDCRSKKNGMNVRLFDANHCPGSVMFLFQTGAEIILHTGDVRWTPKFLNNEQLFPPAKRNKENDGVSIRINRMILDNTFCQPKYDFPTQVSVCFIYICVKYSSYIILSCQKDCFIKIVNLIQANRRCRTYIFVYRIGKEELLINLAMHFQTKIVVSKQKYEQIRLLEFDIDLFTTDDSKGWLFLKGRPDLFEMSITQLNEEKETIFVIPTGFIDKFKKIHPRIHLVNYSSHSSFSELQQFVKAIRPQKLLFSSTKKDYKYENYLIKTYCRDKGPYSHKKEYRDVLGIQTKLNFTMLKSSKQRKCSSDMGIAQNREFLPSIPSQDQAKKAAASSSSSSSDEENKKEPKSLLSIRKANQQTKQRSFSKAQPKKKKVTQRGVQFKNQTVTPGIKNINNKRKMREIQNLKQNIIHEEKKSQRSAVASSRSSSLLQDSFSKHHHLHHQTISSSQRSTRSQQRAAIDRQEVELEEEEEGEGEEEEEEEVKVNKKRKYNKKQKKLPKKKQPKAKQPKKRQLKRKTKFASKQNSPRNGKNMDLASYFGRNIHAKK